MQRVINQAKSNGEEYVDITSGDIHRTVGGYPGRNHRMKSCCESMYKLMGTKDQIIEPSPKSGYGATLTIRYYLK